MKKHILKILTVLIVGVLMATLSACSKAISSEEAKSDLIECFKQASNYTDYYYQEVYTIDYKTVTKYDVKKNADGIIYIYSLTANTYDFEVFYNMETQEYKLKTSSSSSYQKQESISNDDFLEKYKNALLKDKLGLFCNITEDNFDHEITITESTKNGFVKNIQFIFNDANHLLYDSTINVTLIRGKLSVITYDNYSIDVVGACPKISMP